MSTESEALPEAFQLERFFGTARSSSPEEIQLTHLGDGRPATDARDALTLPVNRESNPEVDGLQWFDVAQEGSNVSMASLTPSCFSLVLVCALRGVRLWMPMALTTPIFIAQFGVLYIVSFASPQYLFASGAWLTPNSASASLNVMKTFATVLMLGQIAEEFHEISESMKVLRRSRLSSSSKTRLAVCWGAIMAQYVLALMVMVASGHLILSRQNPIEPLWITYYTFMTLNFDNMLVKFIMYVRTMQRSTTWTVKISEPTPHSMDRKWRSDCLQSLAVLYLPLLLAASVSIFCRVFDVLPMTLIRYGYVSNDRPVVMFSSLALPAGCCPAVASINSSASGPSGDGVHVSVPCLARDAPEDLSPPPMVYWVAWPSHASSPSSLQVREGRGSDGSKAVLSGRVKAEPLELVTWMQHHGYQAADIQEVFLKLTQDQGGIGMYRQTFPYLASIEVFPFPWDEEVAIYAIAKNRKTGALSPRPAASNVLHSRQCPTSCDVCNHLGHCRKCKEGYRVTDLKTCEACPEGCLSCQEDIAQCSQCKAGFGMFQYAKSNREIVHICVPCATANCQNCDRDFLSTVEVPPSLMCNQCESGFGLVDFKNCEKCEDAHCLECGGLQNCTSCKQGFALVQDPKGNSCEACGPACLSCRTQDDCIECQEGYVVKKGECEQCSIHCKKCEKVGPQACDKGACAAGYGTKVLRSIPGFRTWSCERCQVPECQVCEEKTSICDECSEDFGVTVAGKCVRCGLGCATCRAGGSCLKCREGFILMDEMCSACSDRCLNCSDSGPASCNRQGCAKGWTAIPAKWKEAQEHGAHVCRPCSDSDCSTCDVKGPGRCDD